MGIYSRPNQSGKQVAPGLKPGDLCGTYRGLKPAATPKGNDEDSDSSSQNDGCKSQNDGCKSQNDKQGSHNEEPSSLAAEFSQQVGGMHRLGQNLELVPVLPRLFQQIGGCRLA